MAIALVGCLAGTAWHRPAGAGPQPSTPAGKATELRVELPATLPEPPKGSAVRPDFGPEPKALDADAVALPGGKTAETACSNEAYLREHIARAGTLNDLDQVIGLIGIALVQDHIEKTGRRRVLDNDSLRGELRHFPEGKQYAFAVALVCTFTGKELSPFLRRLYEWRIAQPNERPRKDETIAGFLALAWWLDPGSKDRAAAFGRQRVFRLGFRKQNGTPMRPWLCDCSEADTLAAMMKVGVELTETEKFDFSERSAQPLKDPAGAVYTSSIKMMKAFSDNAVAASGTYKGKFVRLQGAFQNASPGAQKGTFFVDVRTGGGQSLNYFLCLARADAETKIVALRKNDAITVRGTIGDHGNVLDCAIVEP